MIQFLNGIHETVAYDICKSLKLYNNEEAEDFPLHWHTALEIIMPWENSYTVCIDNQTLLLEETDILLIPPGILHSLTAPTSGKRLILLFDCSKVPGTPDLAQLLYTPGPPFLITAKRQPALHRELQDCLWEVNCEYREQLPFSEARMYGLLLQFIVTLGRSEANGSSAFGVVGGRQREYAEKFSAICSYISAHCTEDLRIETLADMAGFSRFHFARLFKQYTGVSCCEYLTNQRLVHAQQLLLDPTLSITQVAMCSGFNSLSTFNRVFKASRNCTPSEYKHFGRKG